MRAADVTELILERASPVIFETLLLELISFKLIPVICPARSTKNPFCATPTQLRPSHLSLHPPSRLSFSREFRLPCRLSPLPKVDKIILKNIPASLRRGGGASPADPHGKYFSPSVCYFSYEFPQKLPEFPSGDPLGSSFPRAPKSRFHMPIIARSYSSVRLPPPPRPCLC